MLNLTWRDTVCAGDQSAVMRLTASTGVFSTEEIAIAAELVEEKLLHPKTCSYQFLFAEQANQLIAYTCYGLIPFTDRRFDLYWIAVNPQIQKQGLGRQILQRSEEMIRVQGGLRIYAETSSRDAYLPTRYFYQRNSYQQIAELNDYYRQGDSKVIYAKEL